LACFALPPFSGSPEAGVFGEQSTPDIDQLSVQKRIFEILQIDIKFFFIQKGTGKSINDDARPWDVKTWKELFKCLLPQSDIAKLPRYVRAAIASAGVEF